MPKWIWPVLLLAGSLALLPWACVARARSIKSERPRVHLIQDMDNQGRFKSQQPNPLFSDRRAMREPVAGTVPFREAHAGRPLAGRDPVGEDAVYRTGISADAFVAQPPVEIGLELLQRGRQQYEVFCAPCHGVSGYGDGIVSKRAERLQQGSWVPPASLHAEPASTRPAGHIFNTITNGIRTMPAYGEQIPVDDRWAVTAYVGALQRSQRTTVDDVPPDLRSSLR